MKLREAVQRSPKAVLKSSDAVLKFRQALVKLRQAVGKRCQALVRLLQAVGKFPGRQGRQGSSPASCPTLALLLGRVFFLQLRHFFEVEIFGEDYHFVFLEVGAGELEENAAADPDVEFSTFACFLDQGFLAVHAPDFEACALGDGGISQQWRELGDHGGIQDQFRLDRLVLIFITPPPGRGSTKDACILLFRLEAGPAVDCGQEESGPVPPAGIHQFTRGFQIFCGPVEIRFLILLHRAAHEIRDGIFQLRCFRRKLGQRGGGEEAGSTDDRLEGLHGING